MSLPYFGQVWGWSPTLGKSEDWESFRTPECSELNSKAQNTLHSGVLGDIGKVLKRRYRKWPLIGHLDIGSPKLWAKEGPGVKLAIWLPTTKSQESTFSQRPNWKRNMSLQRCRRELQVWFRPRCDQTLQSGVMSSQSPGTISGLRPGSPGSPEKKWHSGVGAAECHRVYYRE
jgi:hypothetical protein